MQNEWTFEVLVNLRVFARELSAMALLARGYSRSQVAHDEQISEHTLRVYFEGARHKLAALNTTHAVARALTRGLINV